MLLAESALRGATRGRAGVAAAVTLAPYRAATARGFTPSALAERDSEAVFSVDFCKGGFLAPAALREPPAVKRY
ncbi:hypothetical protein AMS69_06170 [Haloarcula rubripromontorii]|uniref:Uncharacterized protein n=1 Tax=Haloarcula rubripromontorii TaxID=1705562 RepID=A0A0M9AJV3_9EURY|nr:hypothetical protein AMS69_06170 [Haloarcula rubripromontorii]